MSPRPFITPRAVTASTLLLLALATISPTSAQSSAPSSSCSTTLTPTNSIQPSVASGYRAALVATGLTKPRSIQFDSAGNLLVVQASSGIESLQLQDEGGLCVSVKSKKTVVSSGSLNHGLQLSKDGKTLYASDPEAAYSWDYDPASSTVSKTNKTLIGGMSTSDHTTRTLLLSQKAEGMLVVSRGSTSNLDYSAESLDSGHSQVRAFNLSNITSEPYDFTKDGLRLGWGLRNSVGVAEHENGGIWTVENSADEITRDGKNVHENNPGEEANFLGSLTDNTYEAQGSNYGYPYCFSTFMPSEIPDNQNLKVGSQFAIGTPNATINDTYCAKQTAPRLTFQAHMAPLDIKFNNTDDSEAWVTFHGSWDRTEPSGYKLSVIAFDGKTGNPVASADSNSSYTDILSNADNSKCPGNCFRPVGLAIDQQGRIFMSSDATGEIYLLVKDAESNGTAPGPSPSTGGGSGGSGGKTSGASGGRGHWASGSLGLALAVIALSSSSLYILL